MRGFEYLIYSAFSLCLITILLALPLAPVFADELISEIAETESAIADEPEVNEDIETPDIDAENTVGVPDLEVDEIDVIDEVDVGNVVDVDFEVSDSHEQDVIGEEVLETVNEVDVPENEADDSVGDEVVPTEGDQIGELDIPENVSSDLATTTPDTPTESVLSESASTTVDAVEEDEIVDEELVVDNEAFEGEVAPIVTEATSTGEFANAVTNDDNRFSFSKEECTVVGGDTYYCAKPTEVAEVTYNDRVFSAADEDGDTEIYIEKDGELTKITDNTSADDSPYYDDLSETIVWHRLVEARYQIMSYNLDDEEEIQMTSDRYNNMQPNQYGDITVWQGWVGNDWEIFQLVDDELTMITDNTTHDISPHINGTHIIWQSFETNAWVMKVYDTRTKVIETVEAGDGGSVENPRFVLVYDTKYDSGDVETKGYDLESGEVIALSAVPAPVPKEIPDPDQTGEERALVSPVVQPKSKVESDDDTFGDDPEGTDVNEDENDIVVPPFVPDTEVFDTSTSTDVVMGTTTAQDLDNDYPVLDLSIDSTTDSENEIGEIEDLIITPFVEPIDEEISIPDSQRIVVTEA